MSTARGNGLAAVARRVFTRDAAALSSASVDPQAAVSERGPLVKTVTQQTVAPARVRDTARQQQVPHAHTGRRSVTSLASAARTTHSADGGSSGGDRARAGATDPSASVRRAGALRVPSTPRPPLTHTRVGLAGLTEARTRPPIVHRERRYLSRSPQSIVSRFHSAQSAHPIWRRPAVYLDNMTMPDRPSHAPYARTSNPYDPHLSRWWSPLISGRFDAHYL
jgi:hypothetical protein